MDIKTIAVAAVVCLTALSCKKEPGEGGQATLTGKVKVLEYNKTFTTKVGEYYAQAEDVYIVYGDEISVGNRTRTHYDGVYQFKYLRTGKYKIYAYSKDSTGGSPSGEIPITQTVEIKETSEELTVPEIIILKN